jgi:UDP-3-O-[3-hydroxymyristoyl] glucosamine N-acyltransferase
MSIHPTAIVHPAARLGRGVVVGPYSIVGEHVEIGDDTVIGPHVVITGHTRIGCDNRIFQFCSIGESPQDKKYAGEPTRLEIGDRNTIRESCTFNCGTVQDVGVTRLGDDNWIMAYVHVAHDCQVGNRTIFANSTQLAGHVHVGDWAILGGFTGVHQFVRVGAQFYGGGVRAPAGSAAVYHRSRQSRRTAQHQRRRPQAARVSGRVRGCGEARLQDSLQERDETRRGPRRNRIRAVCRARVGLAHRLSCRPRTRDHSLIP